MGIAATVCLAVIAAEAALFAVSLLNPERDTTAGFHAVGDVINTLIGLLAGFLAGRTDARARLLERERVDVTDI